MIRTHILRLAHLSSSLHGQYLSSNDSAYEGLLNANAGNIPAAIEQHITNQLGDINSNPSTTIEVLSVEEAEFNTLLQMLPNECEPGLNPEC